MESHNRNIMEEEISKLIDYAFDHGIKKDRINQLAVISYEEFSKIKTRKRLKSKIFWALIVCFIAFVACYCLCYTNVGFAFMRISLIKVLPLWDWTALKKNCIISNPFYDKKFDSQINHDCSTCDGVHVIEKLSNPSHKDVLHKYIDRNIPIIIKDAINDWPAKKHFSLEFLMKLFVDDQILSSTPPCLLSTSFDDPDIQANFHSIATYLMRKAYEPTPFHVHWENCEKKVVKILREFYRRPSFIHSSIEVAPVNWLVVSSNHEAANFIKTDLETPVAWFAQVKGSFKVMLNTPSCNTTCHSLYAVLQEGDIVVWTQHQWQFSYKPIKESLIDHSISMLFGGFLD